MKLIHKVEFDLCSDEVDDSYGLCLKDAIHHNFNTFWNGIGIFHDIFEHWFENKHECFMGSCAYNIGGEIAATGATYYYFCDLYVDNRGRNGVDYKTHQKIGFDVMLSNSVESLFHDPLTVGECYFGDCLESSVPKEEVDESSSEELIRRAYKRILELKPEYCNDDNGIEFSKEYSKSISFDKIKFLWNWGYKMAEDLVPNTSYNQSMAYMFIKSWEEFTKRIDAEELYNLGFYNAYCELYKDSEGNVDWKFYFKSYDIDVEINEDNIEYIDIESFWILEEE